jgi:hypothetical protein
MVGKAIRYAAWMSALGHKRTFAAQKGMSALPPKADMCSAPSHVRFVPQADIVLEPRNRWSAKFQTDHPRRRPREMVRVVRPGGAVATYVWDMLGGGVPLEAIQIEMRAMNVTPLLPPNSSVSRMEALRDLWTGAGLDAIETREITVRRTFANFEDLWTTSMGSSVGPTVAAMPAADSELLKERVRTRLRPDAAGRITYGARANAIKGYVPT